MRKLKPFKLFKKNPSGQKVNKISTKNKLAIVVSVFLVLAILVASTGIIYIATVLRGAPVLNSTDFVTLDSSKVFDAKGNQIADIGFQIRENVNYDDLPQVLIDAFVAVEDSRFFEHNGFDIPRFTKAMFENIRTLSFGQGGSTFTMQLVKGTYFETEEATAVRSGLAGVNRKIREISVAIQAEKVISKKRILELYLNRINYGVPGNKRGIQTAAQFYFGKSVKDVSLVEAAMLAGIINAPNLYNPIYNLENAEKRTNVVLDLMEYHGYITENELKLAMDVSLENLLVGNTNGTANAYPYQAYVDAAVAEVKTLTGLDPVDVPMRIYTTMDTDLQETIEAIQNGENKSVEWPNEIIQTAIITMNNKTGEIIGIGGGRFYNGERLLNRATDMRRQPGSSVKTFLTYPLAFEHLGWSTQHMLEDKPIQYVGTDVIIKNFDNVYRGDVLVPQAIGSSLNIPAIHTLQSVVDTVGARKVVSYLNSIGFTQTTTGNFDIGYGIGGSSFEVSPLQLAGAQASIVSGGSYIQPHTVTRIEFLDGKEPITPSYTSITSISAEAAYMTSSMMEQNVSGPYFNFMQLLKRNFPVYAKTGTSDWGNTGVEFGIPAGSAKDKWLLSSTSEFTTAVWVGYDKAVKDQVSYMNKAQINMNLPGKVSNQILNTLYQNRPSPSAVQRPRDVIDITHVVGVYPYVAPNANTNPSLVVTGLIKSEYANLASLPTPSVYAPSSFNGTVTSAGNNRAFSFKLNDYPDANALVLAPDTKELYLEVNGRVVQATGRRLFDYSWLYGPIVYKVRVSIDGNVVDVLKSSSSTLGTTVAVGPNSVVTACGYYGYDYVEINSSELCTTYSMKDMFINIPELIGQPVSTLNQWIQDNQLTASKFPISEIEPRNTEDIALIGKIAQLDPNLQNTAYETSKKDQLGFTVTVIKDRDINLGDLLNKTTDTLPAYCATYNLCTRSGSATSGKVISVSVGGTTYTTPSTLKLSVIKNAGGIQYTLEGTTTPPPTTTP